MKELLSMDAAQLEALVCELGAKRFAAKQIRAWLLKGVPIEDMTNISKELREKLKGCCVEGYARIVERHESKDGTVKYLLGLPAGGLIECVSMQYHHGRTLCVSTQLGCRMGCLFCASGQDGLVRNLSVSEMQSQLIAAQTDGAIGNVVLMGSGEPLDNYDNVVAFMRSLTADFGIGMRHISLSTCGLVPGMQRLADEGLSITLCISLHAATDEKRKRIMPVAKAYGLIEIIEAAKAYFKNTGRRIIIEYTLMRGFNDGADDIVALCGLLRGLSCHINVIPLNKAGQTSGGQAAPTDAQAHAFTAALEKNGLSATVRRALGSDIEGACGQLKLKREGQ